MVTQLKENSTVCISIAIKTMNTALSRRLPSELTNIKMVKKLNKMMKEKNNREKERIKKVIDPSLGLSNLDSSVKQNGPDYVVMSLIWYDFTVYSCG